VKDFLEVLHSLEENNIFMFHNIQNDEEDLDKFKAESQKKIKKAQLVVQKLNENLEMYEQRIIEKRQHREGLKSMMKSFDSNEDLQSPQKDVQRGNRGDTGEKLSEEEQLEVLYSTISKLFNKV
jgi:uncharacterized membrane protein